jgi:hypothetical protein
MMTSVQIATVTSNTTFSFTVVLLALLISLFLIWCEEHIGYQYSTRVTGAGQFVIVFARFCHLSVVCVCVLYTIQFSHWYVVCVCAFYTIQICHWSVVCACALYTIQFCHRSVVYALYTVQFCHRSVVCVCALYTLQLSFVLMFPVGVSHQLLYTVLMSCVLHALFILQCRLMLSLLVTVTERIAHSVQYTAVIFSSNFRYPNSSHSWFIHYSSPAKQAVI